MTASKAFKMITLTAKARVEHSDFKLKRILGWLKSGHDVRVSIETNNDAKIARDNLLSQIKSEVGKGAKISIVNVKDKLMRLDLKPTPLAKDFLIDEIKEPEELEDPTEDKDLFSGEFEAELEKSIKQARLKSKKK